MSQTTQLPPDIEKALTATGQVNYLLQMSMIELVAERDKLKEVCQKFYDRVYDDNGDMTIDDHHIADDVIAAYFAMKKYNRNK